MRQRLLQIGCFLFASGLSVFVLADDTDTANFAAPAFKLQANNPLFNPSFSSAQNGQSDNASRYSLIQPDKKARSYNAILYYPLHHKGVSIDLGVNLRLQEESTTQTEPLRHFAKDWLNIDPSETQTLIHAAAIFDLPFNGFKAGVSGTYNARLSESEYDYRAKVSYKWRNGFGLEGGWQHQQLSDDQQNLNDSQDVRALFLDMKYRF